MIGGIINLAPLQGELKAKKFTGIRDQYFLLIARFSDILMHLQRNRKGLKSQSKLNFQYGHCFGTLPHS